MNLEEIESYLEIVCNKRILILPKELYTFQECQSLNRLFLKYKKDEIRNTISKRNDDEKFYFEAICRSCEKPFTASGGKTKFFDYILTLKYHDSCIICEARRKDKERQENRLYNESRLKQISDGTDNFIKDFLNPGNEWSKENNITASQKYAKLCAAIGNCNSDKISDYIKSIPYTDFLKTPYWVAIAQYTKYKAGWSCMFCNSKTNLMTHHRTYENHGNEIYNLQDLFVLCETCHKKHHDIKEPK